MPLVTAIIPTLCKRERAESLERAIRSLHAASTEPVNILLVVNGQSFDPALVKCMRSRGDLGLIQIPDRSAAIAQWRGRATVKTEYFCFLDDDDEYLPGALDDRLAVLAADPGAAVVVTNGYRRQEHTDRLAMSNLAKVTADPLRALMQENWLASCGGLFRTADVSTSFFEDLPIHIHWSWLAFHLAEAGKRIAVLDKPTFRINESANSASKSDTYMLSQVTIMQHMLEQVSRPDIARILRARRSQAWHDVSCHHLNKGALRAAWNAHLHSLSHPSGWKFLPYTRKLFGLGTTVR